MLELRFVAAAVWFCSCACAGGDASPDASRSDGAQPEQPAAASPATALADDAEAQVLGGEGDPTTEGSNTNWMPTQPWLDSVRRPEARERPDPRRPSGGQQGAEQPGGAQPGEPSSSGASSGSNNSTRAPD